MCEEPFDPQTPPHDGESLSTECWRCGKRIGARETRCPHCAAPSGPGGETQRCIAAPDKDATALLRLVAFFAMMLGVSVVGALVLNASPPTEDPLQRSRPIEALKSLAVLEGIDTLLVLAALVSIPFGFRAARKPFLERARPWIVCMGPLLWGILAINVAYHWGLRTYTRSELPTSEVLTDRTLLPLWVAVICLQPAVIEELFFRQLALGTLRSVMRTRTAVLVSAVMFALAHVGVPLSMPVLLVLGIALGYARVTSGGLLLPMVMHFVHNAAVIGFEWMTSLC